MRNLVVTTAIVVLLGCGDASAPETTTVIRFQGTVRSATGRRPSIKLRSFCSGGPAPTVTVPTGRIPVWTEGTTSRKTSAVNRSHATSASRLKRLDIAPSLSSLNRSCVCPKSRPSILRSSRNNRRSHQSFDGLDNSLE